MYGNDLQVFMVTVVVMQVCVCVRVCVWGCDRSGNTGILSDSDNTGVWK